MSGSVRISRVSGAVHIAISGRFDFSCHQEFRRSCEGTSGVAEFIVDLSGTDYIDSSALGMLLLLRETAGEGAQVRIVNCRPTVRRILEVANFHTLFPVS